MNTYSLSLHILIVMNAVTVMSLTLYFDSFDFYSTDILDWRFCEDSFRSLLQIVTVLPRQMIRIFIFAGE